MKSPVLCGVLLSLAAVDSPALFAQTNVFGLGLVGYYNRVISPGDNLVANQLSATNNTLNNILAVVPDGTTLTKWDAASSQFLPVSVYSASSQTWTINYSLELSEGALLHSPARFTNTFVGYVDTDVLDPRTEEYTWTPGYANGLRLLSAPVPIGGATFEQVVGRSPLDGEWVQLLDEASQMYSVTTFHAGAGWDNGTPSVGVGQAAWFDLGPVPVPEPSGIALVSLFSLGAALRGRKSAARNCSGSSAGV